MKFAVIDRFHFGWVGASVLVIVMGSATGCKYLHPAARTDQQMTADVQTKIQIESAIAGQNIQASVANGMVTLNGIISDESSRVLAGNESGTVSGVRSVLNNLSVQTARQAPAPAIQARPQMLAAPPPAPVRNRHDKSRHDRNRQPESPPDEQPQSAATPPQVAQVAPAGRQADHTPRGNYFPGAGHRDYR